MKYVLTILALVVVYAVVCYARLIVVGNQSRNPVFKQEKLTIGTGPKLSYVAAGDSTAFGVGASKASQSYPVKLAVKFSQAHQVEYRNIATPGAMTKDFIQNQLPELVEVNPDIITISIGANDRTHLKSNEHIFENFKTMINELTTKTTSDIYIANIPNFNRTNLLPFWYVEYLENQDRKLNPEILKLQTDRVKIVDVHDYGWSKYPKIADTYSADHFHPNDLGYQNWTNAFLEKIK